jgi:hypothetical protein
VALLEVAADARVAVLAEELRVEAEGAVVAARVVERRRLLVLLVVLQDGEADRQDAGDELLVDADRIAERAVLIEAVRDVVGVVERRAIRRTLMIPAGLPVPKRIEFGPR